jgi:hypothetical protein
VAKEGVIHLSRGAVLLSWGLARWLRGWHRLKRLSVNPFGRWDDKPGQAQQDRRDDQYIVGKGFGHYQARQADEKGQANQFFQHLFRPRRAHAFVAFMGDFTLSRKNQIAPVQYYFMMQSLNNNPWSNP